MDTSDKPADLLAFQSARQGTGTGHRRGRDRRVCRDPELVRCLFGVWTRSKQASIQALEWFSDKTIGPPDPVTTIFMKRDLPEEQWDVLSVGRMPEKIGRENTRGVGGAMHLLTPWFAGDQPTLADCALIPRFALASFYGINGGRGFSAAKAVV